MSLPLDGIIMISRVLPDYSVNQAQKEDVNGADMVTRSLHDASNLVRLRCERLGTVDSLCYAEVAANELPLKDNCVEVELAAAGLNFKDIAVTMGIVSENQYLLGLEGAGTIRRVGKLVSSYQIGQRVLVFEKGTFGNRIEATTERVHAIPDSMTFEEASTLASVYLTALYSIHDLADTQGGQRVLIHPASGGLGIATIQVCHSIGAQVFATVGTEEKRQFLVSNFGIPEDHIFNSRSTKFATELMAATHGEGVDVIINSLTGELLDESWRCVAEGGTMVELGKKDILDRHTLSMEPFGRNASYRCFDMAHKCVSDTLIARLLSQLFDLLEQGYVKPITPIKAFSFSDIPSAFRYMRGANHIGKIVITNGTEDDVQVPIRAAPKKLVFKNNVSYLIIGGLKGLCGSLAIQIARMGAKHLAILSRSGYADDRSQGVLKDIYAQGCQVDLVQGDVASEVDVKRAVRKASASIAGIIQGAMVLRDKLYTSMTIEEYHQTISSKVQARLFTLLSSISGLVGQKGQANYAAANVFLDAFAAYRQHLGLAANSVDLGAIEDVGYMSQHTNLLIALNPAVWTPINEGLFHQIVTYSIRQQVAPINKPTSTQLITSIAVPQQGDFPLLVDARFGSLCFSDGGSGAGSSGDDKDTTKKELQAFLLMVKANVDSTAILNAAIGIVNRQFMTSLRLSEPMEAGKSLANYGLDSLAAVEFRNWARMELGSELTTLEVTNATSLVALCEKIISKIAVS